MGTFLGHVLPGSFFIGFGAWWLYNVCFRYYYSKRYGGITYRNISCFPCRCCKRNLPLESLLKIVCTTIGIAGEFYTGFRGGRWVNWGNGQHMTMFLFFGFNGVVDLLQHKKWDLPPKLDYITAALAFVVEAFLFYFHLHGRTELDVMVHTFLYLTVLACATMCIVEMNYPTNVTAALSRVFFTLLQGTWFYQIGFILHSPVGATWEESNHTDMMIVTMMFAWHAAAVLIGMFVVGAVVRLRVKNLPNQRSLYQIVKTMEPLNEKDSYDMEDSFNYHPEESNANGHVINKSSASSFQNMIDSDSDITA